MDTVKTAFARLGVRLPIIQAPMAGVSTPRLVAEVCRAGGLGSLGLGASTLDEAVREIHATRQLTDRPFSVNLFCHKSPRRDPARERTWINHLASWFHEFGAVPPASLHEPYPTALGNTSLLEMLLREHPAAISFHFGLPDPHWPDMLRRAGITTMVTVTNMGEAKRAEDAGIDILIAQGNEAGGHRGVFERDGDLGIGTMALVRILASKTRLPVIAAGGIMDGAGIAAALRLGACAVQMGTAFILCPESAAGSAYRAALKGPEAWRTGITSAISGRPARGIVNRFHELETDALILPDYPVAYDAGKALIKAASNSGCEYAAHWAGQGAPLARDLPAMELMQRLEAEWREAESMAGEPEAKCNLRG